jgi:hypothetical protein
MVGHHQKKECMIMTPEDVAKRVADIEASQYDPEAMHDAEDGLHQDVLQAIANGTADNPKECARVALLTGEIAFPRWRA